ncbi:MAG: peptide ABC transporter substrate-binding protein [Chloroflexi bacterium]|jgi:oligopeptide transport system substrate-binding protein|nr:peptide ABC transporter substrate-binding protein [Chloroflexota bacterium]
MARKLSRRQLLRLGALSASGALIGCAPKVIKETVVVKEEVEKIVKETVVVTEEKVVKETVEVEKVVEKVVEVEVVPTGPTNSAGVVLPADALPLDQQVWKMGNGMTAAHGHVMKSCYNRLWGHAMYDEPLVGLDFDGKPYPCGCESWQISEDGLYWDFILRKELTFTDGSPVTAHDWEFTMKRAFRDGYDYAWYYSDLKNYAQVVAGEMDADELGIEALDDFTLRIHTEQVAPYLPSVMCWFLVMSKAAYEKHGENYELDPATFNGSGPWRLVKLDRATGIEWEVNPNYRGVRTVYFEKATEGPLPSGLPAYMAGEIPTYAIGATTPPGEQAFINSNPVLRAESHPVAPYVTNYLGFNTLPGKFAPLDNRDVRLALLKAIDKEALVAEIGKGFAFPAWGMLPPGFPNAIPDKLKELDPNVFDVEAARQLLSKAGYADGAGFPVYEWWCRDGITPYAEAIQAAWKDTLGIQVNLRGSDYSGFTQQAFTNKEAPIYYVAYQLDYFDPATFLNIWRDGGRHPCELPEWTENYNKANSIMDPDQRFEALQQSEIELVESCVMYGIDQPFSYKLWPCNLAGDGTKPNANGFSAASGGGGVIEAYQHLYWAKSDCRAAIQ